MKQCSRTIIFTTAVVTSLATSPQYLVGVPCGCSCGDQGSCIWSAKTEKICQASTAIVGWCECYEGRCTPAYQLRGVFPIYNQFLVGTGTQPTGSCCETGCYGECFSYFKQPCMQYWVCASDLGEECDEFNRCELKPTAFTVDVTDWWNTHAPCCIDIV